MDTIMIVIGGINAVLSVMVLIKLYTSKTEKIDENSIISSVKDGLSASQRELREEMAGNVQSSVKAMGESITAVQKTIGENQSDHLIQTEKQIAQLQNDVTGKLEIIKQIVDERLQSTLDEKMARFGETLRSTQKQTGDAQKAQIETMDKKLTDSLSAMTKSVTGRQEQFSNTMQEKLVTLEQRFQSLETSVKETLQGMTSNVTDNMTTLGQTQKTQIETMDGKMQEMLSAISTANTAQQEKSGKEMQDRLIALENRFQSLETSVKETLQGMTSNVTDNMTTLGQTQKAQIETMDGKMQEMLSAISTANTAQQEKSGKEMQDRLIALENRFQTLESSNNERLEAIKRTMSEHLDKLSETNQKKLDSIQSMVSEKLESNLKESFRVVSERLEQVHKSLGEMQTIATGVGDLKKVLTNVKTRGIMGEIQLGMILDEILAPDQYEKEIATIPGSSNHVEFAVRLPGADGKGVVYLPIDSKFPGDTFRKLQDAYDSGDVSQIAEAKKHLETVIKKCAGDIRQKYVEPPYTTNFGIMFLPFEGLYAEVVNSGLVEVLQRDYNVTITGPSTMAAMLNSLQMGFRTLAIQKRSNEVWKILGEAKGEFEKFEKALKATQDKITKAGEDLEMLVGRRTRAINRKLRGVEALEYTDNNGQISTVFDDDGDIE